MNAQQLEQRIAAFQVWQYEFQFQGGVRTPAFSQAMVNRQRERYAYFFEPLLALSGGSLAGRRVLDLGCNAGFWSLAAAEAGADFVLGIDVQQEYLDQAALVFEAKEIDPDRYRFERASVIDHELSGRFEVVLCLEVMHHLQRPFALFELFSAAGAELVVIDTKVSRARLPLFELERPYHAGELAEGPLTLVPSRAAVEELAAQSGFQIVALAPRIANFSGMSDYRRRRQLAFICGRGVPLDGLEEAPRGSLAPWWVSDPRALLSAWR